ncbi:hypothetical protein J1D01_07285 [Seonamhaeicola sp. NFXS20]|uniref:hypothetical protein n=1 Tax=Seonamhaeicola sp. NFXS20 TaxID=2816959 RepID=UPI003B8B47C8
MAKLFVKLVFLLFCVQPLCAQNSLCVYKTKGTLLIEDKGTQTSLKKGALINKKSLVHVLPQSELTTIDNNGNSYKINVDGKYNFSNLLNFKVKDNKSSFTSTYFKHIWEELTSSDDGNTLIGGVFRGDLLMITPKDTCKLASSKINLKWQTLKDTKLYYVFIKNIKTDAILKIETNGSQMALYNDNPLFYEGSHFEWTVSTNAFPNLDNLPFFSFELIDRNTYQEEKTLYKDFISDLKAMNLSEIEIESILCETYGLCK